MGGLAEIPLTRGAPAGSLRGANGAERKGTHLAFWPNEPESTGRGGDHLGQTNPKASDGCGRVSV
jgi:hypothetical protein